jgi:PAS domain S-box-containing protein
MEVPSVTREELVGEIAALRQRVLELEEAEATHRKTEEARRESDRRFRSLVEATTDWVWEINSEGLFTYVSSKVKDLLGYEPAEVIGKSPFDFMPEYERERVYALVRELAESRRFISGLENINLHKDGREIVLETCGAPIIDDKGNYLGYRGFDRNITERKEAEEILRQRTSLLEAQLNSCIEGILVVDGQGKKVIQNQRTVELWKIPTHVANDDDDRLQLQHVMHMTKDPAQFLEKVVHLYNHPHETSRDEVELTDGTVLDRYSAPVLGKDGKNYGRIWAFRDITEGRRSAEERERLISELQEALSKVKTLSGLLPICAACKKIRDDEGYWNRIEVYIRAHSEAEFEPGLCPDCAMKLNPEFYRKNYKDR